VAAAVVHQRSPAGNCGKQVAPKTRAAQIAPVIRTDLVPFVVQSKVMATCASRPRRNKARSTRSDNTRVSGSWPTITAARPNVITLGAIRDINRLIAAMSAHESPA
jgi:hypothetical protein